MIDTITTAIQAAIAAAFAILRASVHCDAAWIASLEDLASGANVDGLDAKLAECGAARRVNLAKLNAAKAARATVKRMSAAEFNASPCRRHHADTRTAALRMYAAEISELAALIAMMDASRTVLSTARPQVVARHEATTQEAAWAEVVGYEEAADGMVLPVLSGDAAAAALAALLGA